MDITLENQHLTRQMDIIPVSVLGERITVIGAGAIGSYTVLSLAKMGFSNITVLDDDKVDVENMSCSLFGFEHIGKPKVIALAELVHKFTGVTIEAINKRYEGGQFPGIVISAVDSMSARKLVWENHAATAASTRAIVDPRMSAEMALMYVMNPMDEEDRVTYGKTLYDDQSAVQERCTAKATIYTASMLSGLVAKVVKDLVTGGKYPRVTMWSIKDDDFKAFKKNDLH